MILEDLLVLLDKDESIYPILTIYKNRAITLVKNYLNSSVYDATYIEDNFADAITELVYNAYMNKDNGNIKSKSDGVQSVTFTDGVEAWSINDSVRMLLPLPYVRMMG